MMRQIHLFFLLFFLAFSLNTHALNETDTIINRHKRYLLQTNTVSREAAVKIMELFVEKTGRWSNIDYTDSTPAHWPSKDHLENIKALAVYFAMHHESSDTENFLNTIIRALDEWHKYKFKNPNWWHNEIGVPQLMKDILVLIREKVSGDRLKNYLEIVNQFRISGTGANLVWSSDIALFYGLFTGNKELIEKAVKNIVGEIRISDKEGLRPDYSFHQHGERLQMYQYGRVFLIDNVRLAWELLNTQWAFPKEKIDLLAGMFLNGWQWMARGINTIPETMDRSATRVNALKEADIRTHFPFFIEVAPRYKTELLAAKANQEGGAYTLKGFRGFPYSDFVTFHNSPYSFFLKTISTRTLPTESINYENLKGKLLNSGETYFIQDGTEYFNLMPVWNWDRLPGITSFDGAEKIDRKDFNGIITDGDIGMLAMDYRMIGKNYDTYISCKKAWFKINGYMVCLIGDMKLNNIDSAYTVIDQCRLKQYVFSNTGEIQKGFYRNLNEKWFYHNDFAYRPLYASQFQLYADTVSGTWYDINHSFSNDKVMDSVFMPSIVHAKTDQKSGYTVFFTQKKRKVKKITRNQPFVILQNDKDIQSISIAKNILLAAFYNKGQINFKKEMLVVEKPCLVLMKNNALYVSDPTHKGISLNLQFNNKNYNVSLPVDGSTVKISL